MTRTPDGTYHFVGRRAERMRVHGENVSPDEVEAALAAHPAIQECAVVGVTASGPAGVGDQEILAAVVVSGEAGLPPAELIGYLEERLPKFAVPRYLAFLERLPRTEATQRVQRARVAEEALVGAWDRWQDATDGQSVRQVGEVPPTATVTASASGMGAR